MKTQAFKIFSFLLAGLSPVISHGQNLVPNGSFEIYSSCPNGGGQIANANGWEQYSGSPDYFDSCSSPGFFSVPSNIIGYRYAADGGAYCLIQAYIEGDSTYSMYSREMVGRQLSAPMLIGQKYYVSLKVSLILNSSLGANLAVNKLGALFSTVPYNNSDSSTIPPVNNYAQVYTDLVITDTLNWTMIKGSFIADSAYNYISVGNFFRYQNMTIAALITTPWVPSAVYFVDDIRVSTDSAFTVASIEFNKSLDAFIIYPNPSAGLVKIKLPDMQKSTSISVVNVFGQIVYNVNVNANESLDLGFLDNGVYTIVLKSNFNQHSTKLLIHK